MAEETHDAWLDVYVEVSRVPVNGRRGACPNCGFFGVELQFVADATSRAGFCALWCTRCDHGHVLTGLIVPDGIEFLPLDSPDANLAGAFPPFTDVAALAGR